MLTVCGGECKRGVGEMSGLVEESIRKQLFIFIKQIRMNVYKKI
jgi:hypothetical protein